MESATKTLFYLLAATLFVFGMVDLLEQLNAGEDIQWRMPIILIGFGAGIPIVLFSFPDIFSNHSDSYGEADSSDFDGNGSSD